MSESEQARLDRIEDAISRLRAKTPVEEKLFALEKRLDALEERMRAMGWTPEMVRAFNSTKLRDIMAHGGGFGTQDEGGAWHVLGEDVDEESETPSPEPEECQHGTGGFYCPEEYTVHSCEDCGMVRIKNSETNTWSDWV